MAPASRSRRRWALRNMPPSGTNPKRERGPCSIQKTERFLARVGFVMEITLHACRALVEFGELGRPLTRYCDVSLGTALTDGPCRSLLRFDAPPQVFDVLLHQPPVAIRFSTDHLLGKLSLAPLPDQRADGELLG